MKCKSEAVPILVIALWSWAFAAAFLWQRLPARSPRGLTANARASLACKATQGTESTQSTRRPLDAEDFRELLEQPDGANNIQGILKELLEDEAQLKEYNQTFQELAAAQDGSKGSEADPLAKFLSDPQAVWSWLQSNDKTGELMDIMRGSVLFDKLLKFGSEVLERRQVAELGPGALVEISGLEAAGHLNGLTGTLCEATDEEMEEQVDTPVNSTSFLDHLAIRPQPIQDRKIVRLKLQHTPQGGSQEGYISRCTPCFSTCRFVPRAHNFWVAAVPKLVNRGCEVSEEQGEPLVSVFRQVVRIAVSQHVASGRMGSHTMEPAASKKAI